MIDDDPIADAGGPSLIELLAKSSGEASSPKARRGDDLVGAAMFGGDTRGDEVGGFELLFEEWAEAQSRQFKHGEFSIVNAGHTHTATCETAPERGHADEDQQPRRRVVVISTSDGPATSGTIQMENRISHQTSERMSAAAHVG